MVKKLDMEISEENIKTAVAQFVLDKYQKSICVLKELPSYEDTNILIQTTDQFTPQNKYVLKILSTSTNEASESLSRMIECVKCLRSNHFLCSNFILGVDRRYLQAFSENDSFGNRAALLYSFLVGKELEYTKFVNYPAVILELGSLLAHFHRCLRNVPNKEELVPAMEDPWSLHNYKLLFDDSYFEVIEDPSKKKILSSVKDYVVKTLCSSEDLLRKDILHGDFHGLNVIVSDSYNPADRQHKSLLLNHNVVPGTMQHKFVKTSPSIDATLEHLKSSADSIRKTNIEKPNVHKDLLNTYGIIDFEAMSYSYTVLEVGRLVADMMVVYIVQSSHKDGESTSEYFGKKNGVDQRKFANINVDLSQPSKEHLIKIGGYIMAGYLLFNELSLVDLKCIYPAMLVSLCQYYILGTKAALDPSLSESYVSYCSQEAALLLEFFDLIDADDIIHKWVNTAVDKLHDISKM